ncbi:MAG: hypothetical protein HOK97_17370 [Deltaproteobacteria bacterium]|jgi:hypothetical protein|nr:hypothetical protein [Deltaproteobacteria bacterium]MBT6491544.1 hypothetical protein [Deltaproteobacteria bacterium]
MNIDKFKSGFWLTLLLTAMVGCGEGSSDSNEPTAPDEEIVDDPSAVDESDPGGTEPGDPTDSDPSDSDPTSPDASDPDPSDPDPSEPNLEGSLCAPEPVREDGMELAKLWTLFKSAREEGCYLESSLENVEGSEEWTAAQAPSPADTEWNCDGENRCRQYKGVLILGWQIEQEDFGWYFNPDLALGNLRVWEVDNDGKSEWDVEVDYIRNGSTATSRIERTYDSTGNILLERTYFQVTLRQEVVNTYAEGRLIAQQTVEHVGNGNSATRTRTWSYDADGRMVESTYQRAGQALYAAAFEYGEEGQVVGTERSKDGLRFLAQSWNFEDGRLVSRSSAMEGEVYYEGADSFLPQIRDGYSSHWDDASMRKGRGGCDLVPTSLWHGYPESDEVYVLGWKREEVPSSIGFGYGYDGFGFSYGDYSWMGHGGIATSYESAQMMEATQVATTIIYNAQGKMIEETVESEAVWGEAISSAVVTRRRAFEDDLMTEDSVTAESNSGDMVQFENQRLSFVYDESKMLIERSAEDAGVTTNQTTWTYDTEGRVNEHAIYGLFWNSEDTGDEGLPLTGLFRDTYSVDGHMRERLREKMNIADESWITQRLTRVTQLELGDIEEDDYSYRVRGIGGVLTEVGNGSFADPSLFLRLKRDSSNIVEESGRLGSGGMGAVFRRYTHSCLNQ